MLNEGETIIAVQRVREALQTSGLSILYLALASSFSEGRFDSRGHGTSDFDIVVATGEEFNGQGIELSGFEVRKKPHWNEQGGWAICRRESQESERPIDVALVNPGYLRELVDHMTDMTDEEIEKLLIRSSILVMFAQGMPLTNNLDEGKSLAIQILKQVYTSEVAKKIRNKRKRD